MKIALVITTYGSIYPDVYRNHLACCSAWSKKYKTLILHIDGVQQEAALNQMVDVALKKNCTHMFFMEHDNTYDFDTLDKLLAHDKDVVTGWYTLRRWPFMPIPLIKVEDSPMLARMTYVSDPMKQAPALLQAEVGCFGACLVKTSVFDKIGSKPWFTREYDAEKKYSYTTDICFFNKLKEAGYIIWVDGETQVGHVGDPIIVTPTNYSAIQDFFITHCPEKIPEEDRKAVIAEPGMPLGADYFLFKKGTWVNGDITEHLDTLQKYASECESIVELGVRAGVSTTALLCGKPKRMLSIDIEPFELYGRFKHNAAIYGIDYTFLQVNDLDIQLTPCDLLFIDTEHTYEQLKAELTLHGNAARKYIILHDTESFPSMARAIPEFLEANPHWKLKEHFTNNNGLTILERTH